MTHRYTVSCNGYSTQCSETGEEGIGNAADRLSQILINRSHVRGESIDNSPYTTTHTHMQIHKGGRGGGGNNNWISIYIYRVTAILATESSEC
jgi:hypothetical protein